MFMEWRCNKKKKPEEGDERDRKRFQFFPRCLNGRVRWLEMVKVRQKYVASFHIESHIFGGVTVEPDYIWVDQYWLD